jgi:hypothetical protein
MARRSQNVDGGEEESEPGEPPDPPSQSPSIRGRPVRQRKLNSRLLGYDLGSARGVGGQSSSQKNSDEVTRQGERHNAADFFSQPEKQGVSQFLAQMRVESNKSPGLPTSGLPLRHAAFSPASFIPVPQPGSNILTLTSSPPPPPPFSSASLSPAVLHRQHEGSPSRTPRQVELSPQELEEVLMGQTFGQDCRD